MTASRSLPDQAFRLIHANDVERLEQLLTEHPELLSWRGADQRSDGDGGVLGFATGAYGDCFEPDREKTFTRPACAEMLIDAGAIVMPSVCDGILQSRARGLLQLFHRKGILPRTLPFIAALGDPDALARALDASLDANIVKKAFISACRFQQDHAAPRLLDRAMLLDGKLRKHVDGAVGRAAFIDYFLENGADADATDPWRVFVTQRIAHAIRYGDLDAFAGGLRQAAWLLGDAEVAFQASLIEQATLNGRAEFITTLFELDPAILRRQPPPPSQAIEFAFTYAKTHLLPLLSRIWPLPDDLPHAAGNGDLARVARWFDDQGRPALGTVANHAPATSVHPREHQWGPVGVQQVLDTALAWSVLNHHFKVADFLLEHGADINTNWNSHEPASILHCLVFEDDYTAMQYLIDRGIDMTIRDYRWDATAEGWARHGKNDPKMADWLAAARPAGT